jgi:hypothetical protein
MLLVSISHPLPQPPDAMTKPIMGSESERKVYWELEYLKKEAQISGVSEIIDILKKKSALALSSPAVLSSSMRCVNWHAKAFAFEEHVEVCCN